MGNMKILVLRFSSIGDIVLTSPVVRCLKKQAGAEIHFLTKSRFAAIVEPNPYIDKVWSFQKEITELVPALKKEKFDWVVDLHKNLRTARLKWLLRRPSKAFHKINLEKWMLVRFKIDRLPRVHIVDRYMTTVKHLGVQYDGEGLDYFIPKKDEIAPHSLSPKIKAGNFTVVVLGANHATKRLPEEKLISICKSLKTESLVLLGGKDEYLTGERIVQQSGNHVLNLCGKISLHGSASLIKQARQVLTHDTGLMHIAAAFRKKIVSIWGNTVPEFGMYPFYPDTVEYNTSIQHSDLTCRPCSKIGYPECPKGHFRCMNELDVSIICAALK